MYLLQYKLALNIKYKSIPKDVHKNKISVVINKHSYVYIYNILHVYYRLDYSKDTWSMAYYESFCQISHIEIQCMPLMQADLLFFQYKFSHFQNLLHVFSEFITKAPHKMYALNVLILLHFWILLALILS